MIKPLMNNIYNMNTRFKWAIIVSLNSIYGFISGDLHGGQPFWLGMVLGVFSWFIIYFYFDKSLIEKGLKNQSRKLTLCAIFKIPLQITFIPDAFAGLLAMETVRFIGFTNLGSTFIDAYATTMFTGLYLSILCSVIYLLITGVDKLRKARI